MKKKWIVVSVIALIVLVPVGIKLTSKEKAKTVEQEKITLRTIRASVLASGNLVYQEQAQLSPEVIAKVAEVLVKEGQQVEKGQMILRLDDTTYRSQLEQQNAMLAQQRTAIDLRKVNLENQLTKLRRAQELQQKKMVSEQAVDDAKFAVENARLDVKSAQDAYAQSQASLNQVRAALNKTTIRAPISGTVMAVDIKVGETAVAGQIGIAGASLLTIANTSSIMAEVNVDEADIARMKVGQEVNIRTTSFPDIDLKGIVKTVPLSPKRADPGQMASQVRNYVVKVELTDTKNLNLRPGMTCRAEIFISDGEKRLAVPLQAIFTHDDEEAESKKDKKKKEVEVDSFVYVNAANKAEKRIVKVGISDDQVQEIKSGVKDGELVITGPYKVLRHLKNGEAVSVEAKK